jgi:thiamine-phosphate pyrophosphorylase
VKRHAGRTIAQPGAGIEHHGRLDRVLLLTDRRACEGRGRSLVETVTAALAAGIGSVVFREKDLPAEERLRLGEALAGAVRSAGGTLVVASDPVLASRLGAVALHRSARDPLPDRRTDLPWGRSCHSLAELQAAAAEGAAYATLSPIFPSRSKPGYGPALGLPELARCTAALPLLPIYALGGVDAGTAGPCAHAGARGVAVMGAVMAADDPESAARRLLAALPD